MGSVLFQNNMSLEEMVEIKEQYERIISIINRLPQKEQKRRIKKKRGLIRQQYAVQYRGLKKILKKCSVVVIFNLIFLH